MSPPQAISRRTGICGPNGCNGWPRASGSSVIARRLPPGVARPSPTLPDRKASYAPYLLGPLYLETPASVRGPGTKDKDVPWKPSAIICAMACAWGVRHGLRPLGHARMSVTQSPSSRTRQLAGCSELISWLPGPLAVPVFPAAVPGRKHLRTSRWRNGRTSIVRRIYGEFRQSPLFSISDGWRVVKFGCAELLADGRPLVRILALIRSAQGRDNSPAMRVEALGSARWWPLAFSPGRTSYRLPRREGGVAGSNEVSSWPKY